VGDRARAPSQDQIEGDASGCRHDLGPTTRRELNRYKIPERYLISNRVAEAIIDAQYLWIILRIKPVTDRSKT
jgi:hypothetical protein